MRAGKIVAEYRHGKGKTSVHRLTVLRAGPIGDTGVSRKAADTFVDIAPHLSLKGLDINHTYDRRGSTMRAVDESHVQSRTGGNNHGSGMKDNRSHHNRGGLVSEET
jgi:hypothetical protein